MRLTNIVVQIGNVMAWFVAMRILPDQSWNISRGVFTFNSRIDCKQRIEFGDEFLFTAHQVNQSVWVLRHKPQPLPGVSLHIRTVCMVREIRVKRFHPFPIGSDATHKTNRRIVIFSETVGHETELSSIFGFPQWFGHLRHAPVVISYFQRFRHGK